MDLENSVDQYHLSPGAMSMVGQQTGQVAKAERAQIVEQQKQRRQEQKEADPAAEEEEQRILLNLNAVERLAPVLIERADAIIHEQDVYQKTERGGPYHPMMAVIDKEMDSVLINTEKALDNLLRILPEGDVLRVEGTKLFKDVFSAPAAKVAGEPYVHQLRLVVKMAEKLRIRLPLVQDLGLVPYLNRIEALLPDYDRYLKEPPPKKTYAKVDAAEALAHRTLLALVATMLGVYPNDTPEHEAGRTRLFGPLLVRNAEVAAERRLGPRKKDKEPKTDDANDDGNGADDNNNPPNGAPVVPPPVVPPQE